MKAKAVYVRRLFQRDNHTFTIEWSDGKAGDYRLSELQKRCPCAGCIDEITGKRLVDIRKINEDVRAVRIVSVGRYALRVQFSEGCSTGIYSFDMLRNMLDE